MSTRTRRRIAAASVIVGFLILAACIAGLFTRRIDHSPAFVILFGAISIVGGLSYLHSSRRRP